MMGLLYRIVTRLLDFVRNMELNLRIFLLQLPWDSFGMMQLTMMILLL
jgi:hypothetical protein